MTLMTDLTAMNDIHARIDVTVHKQLHTYIESTLSLFEVGGKEEDLNRDSQAWMYVGERKALLQ
jgi:hypothetical protein